MAEGYQLVRPTKLSFVRFPAWRGPARRGTCWFWTNPRPGRCRAMSAPPVNPELTYLKVKHKEQIFYVRQGGRSPSSG